MPSFDDVPPEDIVTLVQGEDNLNQSIVLNQSVQVMVLVSGEMPFEIEGLLEVPAGRNLSVVGNSSENGEARVEIKVIEEFQVNGTLRLKGLEVSRASLGDQNDSKVDVPLVDVLEGGTVEIIQTELRVKEGEVAVAIEKGSLILREVIIAGELPASMAVTLILVASGDVGDVGDFTAADRAGLVQAIASLADVPPAAVALTLLTFEAVQLTFRICVRGRAEAAAAETRLVALLSNATSASAKLGLGAEAAPDISTVDGHSHCLLGGIALQLSPPLPPPPPPSPPPSPPSPPTSPPLPPPPPSPSPPPPSPSPPLPSPPPPPPSPPPPSPSPPPPSHSPPPFLDHLAEAHLVLRPDVNSEGLSSWKPRPFVRGGACPSQWLPVLLAISMSPSPQTPLPLSMKADHKADHPGANAGVGELPDAEFIIIEDPGVLADHAEEQRRSLAAFPSPKPSPSPETEVGPSNPLQGRWG